MTYRPLLTAATPIFCLTLLSSLSFPEEKAGPCLGQTIRKGEGSVVVCFGMHVDEAQRLLGVKPTSVSMFEPAGIVKEIAYAGVRLEFARDRLEEITYLDDFDFSQQVAPFRDSMFNPPALGSHPLKSRMPLEEFLMVAGAWKASLTEAGYREVTRYPSKMQFSGEYHALKARHYYTFDIGASPRSRDRSRRKKGAIWFAEFTLDDKLEHLKAVDRNYSVSFTYRKKR